MKVVSMSVYKEAKAHREFQNRIRQEKVKKLYCYAKKAICELQLDEFEDLVGTIYDGSKEDVSSKLNELIFEGAVIEGIEGLCGIN